MHMHKQRFNISRFFYSFFFLGFLLPNDLLSIAAGHATESFSDFVVGHGELWSAQMLSYVVRKVHCAFAFK